MADTIERLYKLTVDGAQAARDLNNIAKSTENMDKRMDAAMKSVQRFASVMTGGLTFGAVVQSIQRNIDAMDELSKAVSKVGIAAEDLQRLRYAADLSGVSAEQLDKAVSHLAVGMSTLAHGTTDTAKALRAIGAQSGEGPIDTLKRIADQFQKMPDGIAKTNLAIDLFGKKIGPDMIPMLNAGGAALQELANEADKFGGVLSGGTLQAAEAFNDNMSRLHRTTAGIAAQITAGLLPVLVAITDDLTGAASAGDGFVDTGEGIGQVLAEIYGFGLKATATLKSFGLVLAGLAAAAANPMQAGTILSEMVADIDRLGESTNKRLATLAENLNKVQAAAAGQGQRAAISGAADDIANRAEEALKRQKEAAKEVEAQERRRMATGKILIEIEEAQAKAEMDVAEGLSRNAKEAADAAKAQEDLIRTLDPVGAAAEDYVKKMGEIDDLLVAGAISADRYDRMIAQLNGTFGKSADAASESSDELKILNDGFNSFFENMSSGAADVEDVFRRMVQSIIAELLKLWAKKYIIDTIMGAFGVSPSAAATGAAFDSGQVMPFARGGVISSPIMFPMALAGEAGPEAILPLRRASNGNLGVQAQTSPMNVTVNNYADATITTRRNGPNDIEVIVEKTRQAIAADMRNGGNVVSRSLEQAYGIGRGAAAAF